MLIEVVSAHSHVERQAVIVEFEPVVVLPTRTERRMAEGRDADLTFLDSGKWGSRLGSFHVRQSVLMADEGDEG